MLEDRFGVAGRMEHVVTDGELGMIDPDMSRSRQFDEKRPKPERDLILVLMRDTQGSGVFAISSACHRRRRIAASWWTLRVLCG
jgi:hypothetical protein